MNKIRCLHPEPRTTKFAVKLRQWQDGGDEAAQQPDKDSAGLAAKRMPLATVGDVFGAKLDAAVAPKNQTSGFLKQVE